MDLNPLDIVIHVINIVVLFLILRTLLYKPVAKFMASRTERVKGELDAVAKKQQQADEMKAEYEAKLSSAESDAGEKAKEIIKKANSDAGAIIDSANAKADEITGEAREKADAQMNSVLSEMQGEISDISIDIAKEILRREVNEADNRAIADSFFKKRVKHL